jgi:hypothetical protein
MAKPFAISHIEAVLITAHSFGVDISYSEYPMEDHQNVASKRPFKDKIMNMIKSINLNSYLLVYDFNPIFPVHMYQQTSIISMANAEGISIVNVDKSVLYQELSASYLTDTFHYGVKHGVVNFITDSSLEDVRSTDLPVVCYESVTNNMTVYTVDELSEMFRNNESFQTSLRDQGYFSKESIKKLRAIAVKYSSNPAIRRRASGHLGTWANLVATIDVVEQLLSDVGVHGKALKEYINLKG